MPTYDYICNECGEKFEYFQPMSTAPLTEYPHCKDENCSVKRLISGGSGLIFKGSGFYLTDYKNSPKEKNKNNKSKKKSDKKIKKEKTVDTVKSEK
ncbi:uncharacterized protein METZ01_LOCUS117617 [marine metagenome]|uniref:Putative regulatory protein FmdB zinc ribbon domain-containing protein n=1 Tax=marine metagenome TaxID=408172 RepID=A0A381XKE9_9ZZZZ